jgi:hypothetical protein
MPPLARWPIVWLKQSASKRGRNNLTRRGKALIARPGSARRNRCDGPLDEEWQSVWFHLKGDNFRWIGNGHTLLDNADQNGDGIAQSCSNTTATIAMGPAAGFA